MNVKINLIEVATILAKERVIKDLIPSVYKKEGELFNSDGEYKQIPLKLFSDYYDYYFNTIIDNSELA